MKNKVENKLQKAIKIHGNKYDYSITDFSKKSKETIDVICPIHGKFSTTYDRHVNLRNGCPKCYGNITKTTDEFIKESINLFGNIYKYEKTKYINAKTKLIITCPIHGDFEKTPNAHLSHKQGCPLCSKKKWKLENEVSSILKHNNIDYIREYKFEELKQQPFDFYIPEYNIVIECQGKQHFGKGGWSKHFNFDYQRDCDIKKFNFCKNKKISILYYTDKKYEYFADVKTSKTELLENINYLLVNKNN